MGSDTLKRRLLRRIPLLSRAARSLDRLEDETEQLRQRVAQLDRLQVRDAVRPLPDDQMGPDDLTLPPPALRRWVTGSDDPEWFMESGRRAAQTLVDVLARRQIALADLASVLDFGCGCGRVLRHLRSYTSVRLQGTDYNRSAIAWCDEHLPFAEFGTNLLEPPTRYRAASFDLVYAFSILTHLAEPLQGRWMNEFRRILTPRGHLLITTHGASCIAQLSPSEQATFHSGELVVVQAEQAGRNECGAYHPERYVRTVLARDFDVLEFLPRGALGNPPQDVYLLKPRDRIG